MKGCFALFAVFFLWLIISAVASGLFGVSVEVGMGISALAIFVICVGSFSNSSKEEKEKKSEIDNIINNTQSFNADDSYININNASFIAVDENDRKILIGGSDNDTGKLNCVFMIKASDIIGVELTENGKGLLSSSVNKNTLGMAAIWGLLFGGAGAVVGAISGSNAKSKITEISLRISLDDIKNPHIGLKVALLPYAANLVKSSLFCIGKGKSSILGQSVFVLI